VTADAPRIEKTPAYPNSYRQILSSTVIIASSSIVSIGLGAIRGKCIAILLGPAGTGLFGLYNSILDLSVAVADLGIQGSGVRQIAEASSSRDEQRIARAVTVLRHTSILLGLIGGLLLAATSTPVASLTFGDTGKSGGVALLGLAVFLRLVSGGQSALLQGRRRIGNLALLGIFGAASSTIISVPVVYFFGTAGIVPSILAMALVSTAASWGVGQR
jgi:antigen flippase